MEKRDLILPWSLGCTIYGIWISFCEIFGCPVNGGSFIIPAFVIAGVVSLLFLPWKWGSVLGILAGGTLAVALYSSKHTQRLLAEVEGLIYYVNQRYSEYYGTGFVENCWECSMEHTLLWILLGIYFSVFIIIFAFRLRNLQYGFVPVYLVIAAGLLVGKTPGVRGILFLLVGLVSAMFWLNGKEWGGRKNFHMVKVGRRGTDWHRYPLFFLLLAVVLVLAGRFARETRKGVLSHAEKVQDVQMKLENKVTQLATEISKTIRGDFNVDSNGKLNNSEPEYAKRPVMEITLQEKPRTDLYLRGFVGSHYQNGQWKREDVQNFEELFPSEENKYEVDYMADDQLTQWMETENFLSEDETGETDFTSMAYQEQPPYFQQIQIDYVGGGKWSNYTYLPYFAYLSDVCDVEDDRSLAEIDQNFLRGDSSRPKVSSSYYCKYVGMSEYDYTKYYTSFDMREYHESGSFDYVPIDYSNIEGNPMKMNMEELQKFLHAFSKENGSVLGRYLLYAWTEYGYQEESHFFQEKEFVKKLRRFNPYYTKKNKLCNMTILDRTQFVQKLLKEEAEYSKVLEPVPEGEDYAEYFLMTQKMGFCEHFATAGTLLMRELGIPARYVGGYKVPLDRFEREEDGTYTAEVLDSDAHAWSEVMAGKLGWFPADMTPSSDSGNRNEKKLAAAKKKTTPTPKAKKTKKPKAKATPTVKPTSTANPTSSAAAGQNKRQQGKKNANVPQRASWLGRIAAGAGGVMLIAVLWFFCKRGYHIGRRRRVLHARGKNRNLYVRMRLHDMLSLMGSCGVPVSARMPEGRWFPAIEKFCEGVLFQGEDFGAGDQEEFLRIVQKAAFSKEEVSMEEYDAFRSQCRKLENAAWKKMGKVRRRYLKLTGKYSHES